MNSDDQQDNATIASEASKAEVIAAGYRKTASEGFIYATEQAGTVPLNLYFNADMFGWPSFRFMVNLNDLFHLQVLFRIIRCPEDIVS